ncbi:acyl-CoA synthetase [Marinobacter sp.]|uniref:acyl-CoA synthetase n=1 Tax=Marinobacter sp. TaxID=50741 RepID=UPI003A94B879
MTTQKQHTRALTGIVCGDEHLSHEEFQHDIKRAASGLREAGVKPGDCVAIFMRNDIPFMTLSRATAYIGGYAVPINWHLVGEELTYILHDCAAKILVIHADLWRKVKDEIPEGVQCILVETPKALREAFNLTPEDCKVPSDQIVFAQWLAESDPIADPPQEGPSSMIYTSGTTGHPKGVRRKPLPPENAKELQAFRSRVYGCKEGVRAMVPGPLYHSSPNGFAMQSSRVGDLLLIVPRFDAESFLTMVEEYAITAAVMVPIMFIRLLKLPADVRNKYDLSSLEFVVHAAAPCPADVKTRMIEWFGPVINEFYGSTESSGVTACTSEQALAKPGTVGTTVPEADVRILDAEGNILPPGQIGEIYSRFPNMDFTYNRKPEERAAIDRDGYITSGDMGYFDEDGFLFIADRIKDMIISGGVNIYPAEIEEVLHNCPGIKDCAVFGIPDAEFGESVMAVIETDDGNTIDVKGVEAYLREHLAGYKVPRHIEVGHDLPREDSGKIFKRRLRDKYWQAAGRSI